MSRSKNITIQTDYGTKAEYVIGLYEGVPGMNLLRRITQLVTPVAGVVDTLIRAVSKSVGIDGLASSDPDAQGKALSELMKNLDAKGIEKVISGLVANIGAEGDAKLMIEILACVAGRQATGRENEREQNKVIDHGTFNRIYAGNYGEAIKACTECLTFNFGPALKAMAEGNALAELVRGVLGHLKEPPSSDTPSG